MNLLNCWVLSFKLHVVEEFWEHRVCFLVDFIVVIHTENQRDGGMVKFVICLLDKKIFISLGFFLFNSAIAVIGRCSGRHSPVRRYFGYPIFFQRVDKCLMENLNFHVVLLSVHCVLWRTMNNEFHSIPFVSSTPKSLSYLGFKSSVSMVVVNVYINCVFWEIEVNLWELKIPISCLWIVIFKRLDIISFSVLCFWINQVYRWLELISAVGILFRPVSSMQVVIPFRDQTIELFLIFRCCFLKLIILVWLTVDII